MTRRLFFLVLILSVAACAPRRGGGGGDDDDATGGGEACDGLVISMATGNASCDEPWDVNGATVSLTTHCESDSCSGEASSGSFWIYPGQLLVEFADLDCTVTRVEADITDWAGSGAATIQLYGSDGIIDGSANSFTGDSETVQVEGTGADAVGICGYETQVHEIRLY